MMTDDRIYDAIVVGAGYAGLTAATLLSDSGKNVLILEARERVGGRVYTKHLEDGTCIDLGAQWAGAGQEKLYALAAKSGVGTYPTWDQGKSILFFEGKMKKYKGLIPPLSLPALISLNNAIKKINRLSSSISTSSPWDHPKAAFYDSITLEGWMKKVIMNKKARALFKLASEAIFAADPAEISFLFALFYTHSGRDFDTLMNIRNGAQQDRFTGGADLPARMLAESLGNKLLLNHAVRKVSQIDNQINIYGEGFHFSCKKLIIAIPPALAGKILFEPVLPMYKTQLFQRMPMGSVWKCYAVYEKPFWRKDGLNGLAVSDFGYTSLVFDNSPSGESRGILMGFVLADKARAFSLLDETARRENIIGSFIRFFGDKAANPILYTDHTWATEEWSGGCYTGIMGPHTLSSLGKYLRVPTGNIHWAGTETSDLWNGYIEGAIRSGERVAGEVLGVKSS